MQRICCYLVLIFGARCSYFVEWLCWTPCFVVAIWYYPISWRDHARVVLVDVAPQYFGFGSRCRFGLVEWCVQDWTGHMYLTGQGLAGPEDEAAPVGNALA